MGRSFDEFLRYLFLFIALICLSLVNATQPAETDNINSEGYLGEAPHGFAYLSRNIR